MVPDGPFGAMPQSRLHIFRRSADTPGAAQQDRATRTTTSKRSPVLVDRPARAYLDAFTVRHNACQRPLPHLRYASLATGIRRSRILRVTSKLRPFSSDESWRVPARSASSFTLMHRWWTCDVTSQSSFGVTAGQKAQSGTVRPVLRRD